VIFYGGLHFLKKIISVDMKTISVILGGFKTEVQKVQKVQQMQHDAE
jgi:hypothetical protein